MEFEIVMPSSGRLSMGTGSDAVTTTAVVLADLDALVSSLRAAGRRVFGPTLRDDAIVLAELESAADLPYGWGVRLEPGGYRLRQRADRAAFGHSAGPQSWKQYLHPQQERLWSADRTAGGFTVRDDEQDSRPLAFLGVRSCDLRAMGILDHVLGAGRRYAARRAEVFVVGVNCTEPGETCFCVSAGGGPRLGSGYDIALTELTSGVFLADAGTAGGAELLAALPSTAASAETAAQERDAVSAAAGRMGRTLPPGDLRAMLAGSAASPHWDTVAQRCLTCGNCTMACPTCFCTTVTDVTDLTGDHAERWQRWDSCFDLDFSYLHDGAVRNSGASRYRQWLTHKLSTWHDQFGESGCVGCGRCIVWCPVGIDITAETDVLAQLAEGSGR